MKRGQNEATRHFLRLSIQSRSRRGVNETIFQYECPLQIRRSTASRYNSASLLPNETGFCCTAAGQNAVLITIPRPPWLQQPVLARQTCAPVPAGHHTPRRPAHPIALTDARRPPHPAPPTTPARRRAAAPARPRAGPPAPVPAHKCTDRERTPTALASATRQTERHHTAQRGRRSG
jgi:hypothetical protein